MMSRIRAGVVLVGMIAATIGAFLVIWHFGNRLAAGQAELAPQGAAPALAAGGDASLGHVLIALVVIVVIARLMGLACKAIGQPPVVGEMIAGVLLGPSLLGRFAPQASAQIFPTTVIPYLSVISQIGIIVFMFLVGVELDSILLRHRTRSSVAISQTSIIAPFLLGSVLALWLYPSLALRGVGFTEFALFIGVAMSVTAFPVLARILKDRGMNETPVGVVAIGCAAVDDVTAWCLLAFVVGVARAQPGRVLTTVSLTAVFILVILVAIRPMARWLAERHSRDEQSFQTVLVIVAASLFLAALATERIGIHAFFGAFLLGVVVPHDSPLARELKSRFEGAVVAILLPVFFAFTGLRTQIGLLHSAQGWAFCGIIIFAATAGKFGGSYLAARLTGLDANEATIIGILMNTRGLMELIVLNTGLDLGVISPMLFAMLVIMAVATTFATTPVLQLVARRSAVAAHAVRTV